VTNSSSSRVGQQVQRDLHLQQCLKQLELACLVAWLRLLWPHRLQLLVGQLSWQIMIRLLLLLLQLGDVAPLRASVLLA
jgi:hypothetical protein